MKRLCIWEITSQCNEMCKMCNIRNRTNMEDELFRTKSEIEFAINFMKEKQVTDVYVQGGEPLIHPEIKTILECLSIEGFNVRVISNAIKLDENIIDFLIEKKIGLTVSLDTLDEDVYNLIRGKDVFSLIYNNLIKIKKKDISSLYWGIHSVITNHNINEIMSIKKFAQELGMVYSAFPLIDSVGIAGTADKQMKNNEASVVQILEQLYNEEKDEISQEEYKVAIQCVKGIMNEPCDGFKYSFVLDECGNIKPCIERNAVCNIFKEDIDAITVFNDEADIKCKYYHKCFYGGARTYGIIKRKNG